MITPHRTLVRSLFVLLLVFLAGAPAASADRVAPESNTSAEAGIGGGRLKAELKQQGFEVKEGYFNLWGIEQCPETFELMGTCFFNNPAAPYVVSVVPHWSDEFVDPATRGAFGKTKPRYGATYRFDPNEAILIFGYLPPEAAYFGLQSYLFSRKGEYLTDNDTYRFLTRIGAGDVFFHTVPQNPGRIGSFDSLSDSTNNVVIERQSGSSWNQFRYFIITPDQRMDREVREVLARLSVADEDIFTEGIPSNMRIGLDADADDFLTAVRYSMPADGAKKGTPSDRWRSRPKMGVLRIRDAARLQPTQRYPAWEDNSPEFRSTEDESYLKPDLISLAYKVSQIWGQPCNDTSCSTEAKTFIDTQSYPFNMVGPLCDNIGMDCQADTQDASYQMRGDLRFDDNEVHAVVGTLGTATGNATYVSLGVNNFRLRLGAANIDGTKLAGSTDPEWHPG